MSKSALDGLNNQPHISFPCYSTIVNYDQTVEQLIKAGKYDWFEDRITSDHFPSSKKGQVEVLIYLAILYSVISEDALEELDCLGLRPVTLKELLALGIAHPDLQRNKPIVGLGSAWCSPSGYLLVPFLYNNKPNYRRYLRCWSGSWFSSKWRFAAVLKCD